MTRRGIFLFWLFCILALNAYATNYAILLGTNTYEYNLNSLRYAEKDVADMEQTLRSLGFEVQTITGSRLTKVAVKAAIKRLADKSIWEDLLVVYFSGHGGGNPKGLYTYYSEVEGDSEYYTQEQLIGDMRLFKGKRALILDACLQGITTKDWERKQSLGVREAIESGELDLFVAAGNSQQLANDGAVVNGKRIENGIVTYLLLEGIKSGEIDFDNDKTVRMGDVAQYITRMSEKVAMSVAQKPEAMTNSPSFQLFKVQGSQAVTTPQNTKGSFEVKSSPSGAKIEIGGTAYGNTPRSFEADPGSYSVTLRMEGYEDYQETVRVEAGKSQTLTAYLKKKTSIVQTPTTPTPSGMARVKGGSFQMGSNEGSSDEKPVHTVTLMYDYWIGKYEVTFNEYDTYCAATGKSKPSDEGWGRGTRPVMNVTWWDAIGYCNWLSEREGLKKAYDDKGNLLDKSGKVTTDITKVEGYRLPTEAEWEYAARGGQNSKGYKYAGSNDLNEVGWYWQNSGDKWLPGTDNDWDEDKIKANKNKTRLVGEKKPNELGLYDMSGNVWEWCHDWYGGYSSVTQTNPVGPSSGAYRVNRGGSWYDFAQGCRAAYRGCSTPTFSNFNLGFRVSRTVF